MQPQFRRGTVPRLSSCVSLRAQACSATKRQSPACNYLLMCHRIRQSSDPHLHSTAPPLPPIPTGTLTLHLSWTFNSHICHTQHARAHAHRKLLYTSRYTQRLGDMCTKKNNPSDEDNELFVSSRWTAVKGCPYFFSFFDLEMFTPVNTAACRKLLVNREKTGKKKQNSVVNMPGQWVAL